MRSEMRRSRALMASRWSSRGRDIAGGRRVLLLWAGYLGDGSGVGRVGAQNVVVCADLSANAPPGHSRHDVRHLQASSMVASAQCRVLEGPFAGRSALRRVRWQRLRPQPCHRAFSARCAKEASRWLADQEPGCRQSRD